MEVEAKQLQRNKQWTRAAVDYDSHFESSEAVLYRELEADMLIRATGARPGLKILDVCCGTGRNTLALAETGAQVWGIDAASGMILKSQQKAIAKQADNAIFINSDAISLPFPDNSFDAVTGTRFMYMMRRAEKELIIAELKRVLKPGGTLVLQFRGGFWGLKDELLQCFRGRTPKLGYRYLWPGQAKSLFDGFQIVSVSGVKIPRLAAASRILGQTAAARLNQVVRLPLLSYLSADVLVVARRTTSAAASTLRPNKLRR